MTAAVIPSVDAAPGPSPTPTSDRSGPGASHRSEPGASDTAEVVRTTTWVARGVAVMAVGAVTFDASHGDTAQLVVQIVAFVIGSLALSWWAWTDRSAASRAGAARMLPVVLTLMTVTSAVAAATHNGGGLLAFGFIAVMAAASDASLLVGWGILVVGAVAAESAALAYGRGTGDTVTSPLVLVVAMLIGQNRRTYRIQAEQSAALVARAEQLREEQHRVATLEERTRIAREIHDVLAHSLGALGVQIQAARAVLTDQHDEARTAELLDQAQRMATDGLVETRRAVHALRSDTPPLADALAELSAAHQRAHHAPVELRCSGAPRLLSPDAALALTRVAQEALVNAAKHAAGRSVDVVLDYDEGATRLAVTNPLGDASSVGPGDGDIRSRLESVNGGYGLAGMRERLLLIGGSLDVGPRDDGTWVVAARVPQ